MLVSQWVTHRLPSLWERPEAFSPRRFAPDRAARIPRFAFFPFLGGPRQCIGAPLANLEAQLLIATVVPRLAMTPFPLIPVEPEPWVTLRPRFGVHLIVKPA